MRTFSTLRERYIEAFLPDDVADDTYDRALGELKAFLEQRYPESFYTKRQNWNCNVVVSENAPPKLEAKLSFIHDIWSTKKKDNERRTWRVRLEKGRIIINYCKNQIEDSGSFSEFLNFCEPIINFYLNKIGIKSFSKINLNYHFKYDFNTIDNRDFSKEDWIEVKEIFTPFAAMHKNVPSEFKSFVRPYNFEQRLLLENDFLLCSILRTSKENEGLGIFMTLTAWKMGETSAPCTVLSELFEKLEIIYCLMLTEKVRDYLKDDWK